MLLIAGGVAYGITAAVTSRGTGAPAMMALGTVIGLIGYGLAALVISGTLAALVGIEAGREPPVTRADPSARS